MVGSLLRRNARLRDSHIHARVPLWMGKGLLHDIDQIIGTGGIVFRRNSMQQPQPVQRNAREVVMFTMIIGTQGQCGIPTPRVGAGRWPTATVLCYRGAMIRDEHGACRMRWQTPQRFGQKQKQ